jgi:hypothetical protein
MVPTAPALSPAWRSWSPSELATICDCAAPVGVDVRLVVWKSRLMRRSMAITGFDDQVFAIFGSVDDALAAEHRRTG